MRDSPQHFRNESENHYAVCGGKFGLVRHYAWRTVLCSKKCCDRFNMLPPNKGVTFWRIIEHILLAVTAITSKLLISTAQTTTTRGNEPNKWSTIIMLSCGNTPAGLRGLTAIQNSWFSEPAEIGARCPRSNDYAIKLRNAALRRAIGHFKSG